MQPDHHNWTAMADPPAEPIYPASSHMQVIAAAHQGPTATPQHLGRVTGASTSPGPDWAARTYTGLLACNDFHDDIVGGYEWSSRLSPRALPSSTVANFSEPGVDRAICSRGPQTRGAESQ